MEIEVGPMGVPIMVKRKDSGVVIFTLKNFAYKQSDQIEIITEDHSTKWGMG